MPSHPSQQPFIRWEYANAVEIRIPEAWLSSRRLSYTARDDKPYYLSHYLQGSRVDNKSTRKDSQPQQKAAKCWSQRRTVWLCTSTSSTVGDYDTCSLWYIQDYVYVLLSNLLRQFKVTHCMFSFTLQRVCCRPRRTTASQSTAMTWTSPTCRWSSWCRASPPRATSLSVSPGGTTTGEHFSSHWTLTQVLLSCCAWSTSCVCVHSMPGSYYYWCATVSVACSCWVGFASVDEEPIVSRALPRLVIVWAAFTSSLLSRR